MRSLLLAGVVMFGQWISSAHASYIVNFSQVGNDVVATGSGTLSLAGLTFAGVGSAGSGIIPSQGVVAIGVTTSSADYYRGVQGPNSFGTGGGTSPTTAVGALAGIEAAPLSYLIVPRNYVSGTNLTGTDTFANATFASLGLVQGQYIYSWSSPADTFVINIPGPTPVPEPTSFALLSLCVAGVAASRRRVKR